MGINENGILELFKGEHELMENFHILFYMSIEAFIRKEAVREEVPKDTVQDSLNVSPTANQLQHQFTRLFAQVFVTETTTRGDRVGEAMAGDPSELLGMQLLGTGKA